MVNKYLEELVDLLFAMVLLIMALVVTGLIIAIVTGVLYTARYVHAEETLRKAGAIPSLVLLTGGARIHPRLAVPR